MNEFVKTSDVWEIKNRYYNHKLQGNLRVLSLRWTCAHWADKFRSQTEIFCPPKIFLTKA